MTFKSDRTNLAPIRVHHNWKRANETERKLPMLLFIASKKGQRKLKEYRRFSCPDEQNKRRNIESNELGPCSRLS